MTNHRRTCRNFYLNLENNKSSKLYAYTPWIDMAGLSLASSFTEDFNESESQSQNPSFLSRSQFSSYLPSSSPPLLPPLPSIPSNIQILHLSHEKYAIFETATQQSFFEWWSQTLQGKGKSQTILRKRSRSDDWEAYLQAANIQTGEIKLVCKRCKALLKHPKFAKTSTTGLHTHLLSQSCRGQSSQETGIREALVSIKYSLKQLFH